MSYQTIEVHNSTPHIGAEIRGVDLSNPLGNQQFQEVHDALTDRLVIFFRDQRLSVEHTKTSLAASASCTCTLRRRT
jgi:taurine dioxygenase